MHLREWQLMVAEAQGFDTLRRLHEMNMRAFQCRCGEPDCPGWTIGWPTEDVGLPFPLPLSAYGPPRPLLPWAA